MVIDQGGKLYNNSKVVTLFCKFDYEVLPTGAGLSFQNGPVKQAHCTFSQGIKSLFIDADLDIKFWPYMFLHVLRIQKALLGAGQTEP